MSEFGDRVAAFFAGEVRAEGFERLFEAKTVAIQEHLEPQGQGPAPLSFGRGAPLPPQLSPVVEKQPLDHRGEIGSKRTASLEGFEDRIAALDDREIHLAQEVVRFTRAQSLAAGNETRDAFDIRKRRNEKTLERGARCLRFGDSLLHAVRDFLPGES